MGTSVFYKQYMAHAQEEARLARKKRYQRLVGLGLGGAGLAAALAGMPFVTSLGFWALSAISWRILKAV